MICSFVVDGSGIKKEDLGMIPLRFSLPPRPEGIPADWPWELPFPENVRVISAGYDESGRYCVDIADEDWSRENMWEYSDYACHDQGYRVSISPHDSGDNIICVNAKYRYFGWRNVLQMQCYEGCTSEIVLVPYSDME